MKRPATRLFLLCVVALLSAVAFSGCIGPSVGKPPPRPQATDVDKLRKGDTVVVTFSMNPPPSHEERIKEDGTIVLPQIGVVVAEGKTAGQLQKEIQDAYVPKYYRNLTVTVKPPERQFYVLGEVKLPNRYLYTQGMTVLRAIATAGGFTDFANRTEVQVTTRDGEQFIVNCKKAQKDPSWDLAVHPDDHINVPKRFY